MAPTIQSVKTCLFAVAASVHLRGEPVSVSSDFSMACYSIVSY